MFLFNLPDFAPPEHISVYAPGLHRRWLQPISKFVETETVNFVNFSGRFLSLLFQIMTGEFAELKAKLTHWRYLFNKDNFSDSTFFVN